MTARLAMSLAVVALLGGCATPYEVVEQSQYEGPDKSYTVALPLKWVRVPAFSERVDLTRDGTGLQRIVIARVKTESAFPKVKRPAGEKLLPSELADLQIAELRSVNEQLAGLVVVENAPATVGGRPGGFRLEVSWTTARGLKMGQVHHGIVHRGYYYLVSYQAPLLYYFGKYRPEFEQMATSFRLN
jgi:hypothetical protein